MRRTAARKPAKTSAAMVPFANLPERADDGAVGGSGWVVLPLFPDDGDPELSGGSALDKNRSFSKGTSGLWRIKGSKRILKS